MVIKRTYRYPLKATKPQLAILESWRQHCQWLYNGALEERRNYYKKYKKSISFFDQCKSLVTLRNEDLEWENIPSVISRSALKRLDLAFKAFFRRLKAGETPGFPRFKPNNRFNSFSLMSAVPKIENGKINLPKLGWVKYHEYRPLPPGAVCKDVKLNLENGEWFLCLDLELGPAPIPKELDKESIHTGIDLGLTHFATLADGSTIENPRYYKSEQRRLRIRQRRMARRKKGSCSRERAKTLVAKSHQRIKNQRKDFAWKSAKKLVSEYDLISHENLNIRGMVRGYFSKSINDAGWGIFLKCLACKAEEAGKLTVGIDPYGTSQMCSHCHVKVPKVLGQHHDCHNCGLSMDRDHNAARNIDVLGYSTVYLTAGSKSRRDSAQAGRSQSQAKL